MEEAVTKNVKKTMKENKDIELVLTQGMLKFCCSKGDGQKIMCNRLTVECLSMSLKNGDVRVRYVNVVVHAY